MKNESTNTPKIIVSNGEVVTDSRAVARLFGRQHKDVLKAIRNLIVDIEDDKISQRNFFPREFDLRGKTYPCYEITRDGFSLLAMGFTGAKATKWKVSYLEAFNRMEATLLEQRGQIEDQRPPAAYQIQNMPGSLLQHAVDVVARNRTAKAFNPNVETHEELIGLFMDRLYTKYRKNKSGAYSSKESCNIFDLAVGLDIDGLLGKPPREKTPCEKLVVLRFERETIDKQITRITETLCEEHRELSEAMEGVRGAMKPVRALTVTGHTK